MAIAKLFLGVLLVQLVHLSAMGLVGALSGAKLKEASLGLGPVLRRIPYRGAVMLVRLLPISGYVQFWRRADEPPAPQGTPLFDDLPPYKRAATHLAGVVALFGAGSALAGSLLWRQAADGVIDLARGAIAPSSTGADLVGAMIAAARTLPFHAFVSLLFVKIAAWNALPIPSLNGGAALLDLAVPREKTNIHSAILITGMIVMLAWFISWTVALVTFLLR